MFKLVLYFNSVIISNQIKYYLARNRGIFCKYSIATVSNDSFLLKEHVFQEFKEVNAWNMNVWSHHGGRS